MSELDITSPLQNNILSLQEQVCESVCDVPVVPALDADVSKAIGIFN
jgi:hypothetical protein